MRIPTPANQIIPSIPTVEYCLYARKSSEDDERQAMSIDSQIKEMNDMAIRDGVFIKEIRKESHSAKMSGQRPVFSQLISDIRDGMFTGILTWAPDRLSRNAGDLGMLVDLMDQEKLHQIKTFSQSFSNNPNEKFLLMILCSQAKLENDQKGINVKRGIRAKCEMGWRPGMPPIGYWNRAMAGVKDIVVDPDRGQIMTEMFERVAKNGDSGRTIKRWFDKIGMTTRKGKGVTLSQIYQMLKNPFYYGEFEFPIGSGNWYEGKHKPLITKELFINVQLQLVTCPKSPWGEKIVIFKGLFKCGSCGSNIIGEEKMRKRKVGEPRRHVYYHCARQLNNCLEAYISEDKLIKQILRYINFMNIAHPNFLKFTDVLKTSIASYLSIREEILYEQDINPISKPLDPVNFARYILTNGTIQEKRDLVTALDRQLYIKNRFISAKPHEETNDLCIND
jgi:DNA invertase Pin-like site-specific DNA recombinase